MTWPASCVTHRAAMHSKKISSTVLKKSGSLLNRKKEDLLKT